MMDHSADFTVIAAVSRTPPVTGQGLAGNMLLDALAVRGIPTVALTLSEGNQYRMGPIGLIHRTAVMLRMCRSLYQTTIRTPRAVFYLHVGQSTRAFIRDIALLRIANRRGVTAVIHVHGGGFRRAFDAAPAIVQSLLAALLADVSAAVALTPSLTSMFDDLVPPERVRVVQNGIAHEIWRDAPHPSARGSGEPLRVLFLGNLIPEKGYLVVLEAAAMAAELALPIEFTIAGARLDETAPRPDAIVQRYALNNVRLTGAVSGSEKRSELERADVFLMPTQYPVEGQPLAILEAMHFGLAVVATHAGGIADVVDDHRTGYLLDRPDAKEAVKVLEMLVNDDVRRVHLGSEGRRKARTFYTATRHEEELTALLASEAAPVRTS